VDLKRYGWDPSRDLSEEERERILGNAGDISVTVGERFLHMLSTDPASPFKSKPSGE